MHCNFSHGANCNVDSLDQGCIIPPTQLESKGLEVLMKEERLLTREEAAEFYKQHEGSVSAVRIPSWIIPRVHCYELLIIRTHACNLLLVMKRGC